MFERGSEGCLTTLAAKGDDLTRLKALSVSEAWAGSNSINDDDDVNVYMGENEIDGEDSSSYASIADRWFNGLIDNDVEITWEVYTFLRNVDFVRQELRKLVFLVQSSGERPGPANEVESALKARKSVKLLIMQPGKAILER